MIHNKNATKKNYTRFIIYKIENPDKEVYVGITTDLERRKKRYRQTLTTKKINDFQPDLYKSFKKWGYDAHLFDILDVKEYDDKIDLNEASIREQHWINVFYIKDKTKLLNIVVKGVGKNWKQSI